MPLLSVRTPLLGSLNRTNGPQPPPGLLSSLKFFFGSWLNILLVFVPLSVASHHYGWAANYQFACGLLALIPLAGLVGAATEQLEVKLGRPPSRLLNASFGNILEIFVGFAALRQNQLCVAHTFLVGSILLNLLLVLGISFFAGGMRFRESEFRTTAAQASSSLMMLACITLVIPAAYHGGLLVLESSQSLSMQDAAGSDTQLLDNVVTGRGSEHGIRIISHVTAVLLLLIYTVSLIYEHKNTEYLYLSYAELAKQWHAMQQEETDQAEQEEVRMNVPAALSGLLIAVVGTAFCAEYFFASIEETSENHNLPKVFIGLVILPIVVQMANAQGQIIAMRMAMRDRMAATITINVGKAIQIATFVVPLLVLVGWVTQHDLTLHFGDFETIVLFVSVVLVNSLVQDGKSNYMEGLMLVTLYFIIAIAFWVS